MVPKIDKQRWVCQKNKVTAIYGDFSKKPKGALAKIKECGMRAALTKSFQKYNGNNSLKMLQIRSIVSQTGF
ncbi:MAG: hypothetical protein HS132_02775 [Planctomycetia bacterium]|nr:hypothetical protein [Planctomycetia bacterium]